MKRFSMNKARSARKFSGQMGRIKALNVLSGHMRGGIRL